MPSDGSSRNPGLERGERAAPSSAVNFRTHKRYATPTNALVTHVKSGWQRRVAIENIGLGGARLVLDDELLPGDLVTLSFAATVRWEAFVFRSRVVWVASPMSGVGVTSGASPSPRPDFTGVHVPASARELHGSAGVAFLHTSAGALLSLHELISGLGGD